MNTYDGISIPMAIVDLIPVVLFFMAALLLLKDLYNKLYKGAYALLATGSIMVLTGGIFKALWKVLVALGICDFRALDISFFPLSGVGFMLVFLSLVGSLRKHEESLLAAVAVPEFTSNMPFVALQIVGCAGMQIMLMLIAKKMKATKAIILFVIAFITMLGMGYLSAKFDDSSSMHWMAQGTNIISNLALYLGVRILHKDWQ